MKYWIFLLLVFAATQMQAQGSIGFKTGLNFAKIDGPADINDQGASVETWDRNTGFHIGVTYTYPISDAFKLRGELLYSRKGGKYKHIGQYYSTFTNAQGSILTTGQGEYLVNISNTYLDLPISAVYKWRKTGAFRRLLRVIFSGIEWRRSPQIYRFDQTWHYHRTVRPDHGS